MPRPRLLTKHGEIVPQWIVSSDELRRLMTMEPKPRPLQRAKRARLTVPKNKLALWPEVIGTRELLKPEMLLCRIYCPPRYRVRKNQKDLKPLEWARFIHAIEALAESGIPSPSLTEFVDIHHQAMTTPAGMAWGAHGGLKFLPWHREYLAKLESRLLTINPLVTIPYWNWVEDRAIPPQLSDPADLAEWGVTRGANFNSSLLPTAAQLANLMTSGDFATFSGTLEATPFHNRVHGLVGGTMGSTRSPADPLFWLHHAFIDKLWADWQQTHQGAAFSPPSMADVLQPPPIMTRTVSQVVSITALGYVYA